MTDTLDHERLLAEIDEEVARRRRSGDLPPGLERELDLAFARFAPVHVAGDDFGQVLERAEQSTFIDVLAPLESARPGVPLVKRVIRKAILWVVRHVAQQVSGFAEAITKAVRLLGQRVDALERAVPGVARPPAAPAAPAVATAPPDAGHWAGVLAPALARLDGRVAQVECGSGELLAGLVAAGVDAYGVEPSEAVADAGLARGLEVRVSGALDHLRAVPGKGLAAVVLSRAVDTLPVGARLELLDVAVSCVGPGGAVVVVGTDPRAGDLDRSAVEADLAGTRPFRSATWRHLLASRGFDEVTVHLGPRPAGLEPLPEGAAGADPLNANLERLNELLFPPRSYAVVATRPR